MHSNCSQIQPLSCRKYDIHNNRILYLRHDRLAKPAMPAISMDKLELAFSKLSLSSSSSSSPTYNTTDVVENIKQKGLKWVDNMLKDKLTRTKPGSISYLLYGEKPSEQSINIKLGKLGEFLAKELINFNSQFDLLNCGIQTINDKKKDVDLIFKDKTNNIIYYRELKGNIELDTEKIPATIDKCNEIEHALKCTYKDCKINCGILNWSVYERKILTAGISNIRTFENNKIKIDHMADFLKIINTQWDENDYYSYFRTIGEKIANANLPIENSV